jgi:NADH-quinone oxidoreductase subunit M
MPDKFPILSLIIFLPAALGLSLCFVPRWYHGLIKWVALTGSVLVFAGTLFLYLDIDPQKTGLQYIESTAWIPELDIYYKLGIDGLSLVLLLLTALLVVISVLCSWDTIRSHVKAFYISMLFLETGMIGTLCAADLFLFYIFWEVMLIPMYLLIGVWGGPGRIHAAIKFIIFTMLGSLVMLGAILYLYFRVSDVLFDKSFDIQRLTGYAGVILYPHEQKWLFLAFALAFAIKVPLFPLHTWLPDAHTEAPTAGSVILAGVLLKMGVYGFLRLAIPFFPKATIFFTPAFMILAIIGIIFGAFMAMVQNDIKRLIAYSSVSHLGFVVLGIFSFKLDSMQGGILQMINHGISTGALFLLVGIIYERTHKRMRGDFSGMAQVLPGYATIFMIVMLSSIGLPGLNGFAGEFLILLGTFKAEKVAAAVAVLGVILGAVYMLKLYSDIMWGKVKQTYQKGIPDVTRLELVYLAPIVLLIFWIGVAPQGLLKKTEKAAQAIILKVSKDGPR